MSSAAQRRSTLARQLVYAIATPLVLLVLLGLVLGRQVLKMADDAQWVDHTDEVLVLTSGVLREVVDQESSLRGYLLTREPRFLDPYRRARPLDGFDRLHALVHDNPVQQDRIREARHLYETWVAAAGVGPAEAPPESSGSPGALRERKALMDSFREAMRRVSETEDALRRTRVLESERSLANTKQALVALIAFAAVVLAFLSRRQLSVIASHFGSALDAETAAREAIEAEAWIRNGHAKLAEALQGDRSLEQVGREALEVLVQYTKADVGAFFAHSAAGWTRRAAHALDTRAEPSDTFADGEGLVGRAAQDRKVLHLTDVPPDFLRLRSGTGEHAPTTLLVVPACVDGAANSVVELGFLRAPGPGSVQLLERIGETLALAVRSAEYQQRLRELLEESQRQAEELQTQQEELRVSNEELEAQTTALRSTQKQLETQQAELEQLNAHLEEQTAGLEEKNDQLARTQADVLLKSREVERASQYKSEFLSNMSHELRTPLNSSLILAKLLADNKDGNLTDEQVKFAETISAAGNDLLTLINDILDLSKIEAGKMDVSIGSVPLTRVRSTLLRTFEPLAQTKGIEFRVDFAQGLAAAIETDGQRLEQILKNLASNAIKFTKRGEVVVEAHLVGDRVEFSVRDTGIGIAAAEQTMIFEAFRQADGTTNRKYGGTGLGLSISRELARLLGGEISVTSVVGTGSTFVLTVPVVYRGPLSIDPDAAIAARPALPVARPARALPARAPTLPPRQDHTARAVLVIEDDEAFAAILADVAREAGFECTVATTAEEGVRLAAAHPPTGIVLDMHLPDHTGLSVLDRLKRDPRTRHVPVHVISANDYAETALSMGAAQYLLKPVQREQLIDAFRAIEERSSRAVRRVLVVDDDETLRASVAKLLGSDEAEITTAGTAEEALAHLKTQTFDCVVTDLGLPGKDGYELLETMAAQDERYSVPPVIVYTGRALTEEQEQRLRKYSASIIVKGARSPERLLDEVTLFLHQVESKLAPDQQRLLKQARHRESVFEGRTVLVVEDDVRNVFALTSVLEPKGLRVVIARNGREGLQALEREPSVDLVLMDLMMPEMDGLEATREIRKNPRWKKLPVIALTAKAMRDDQEQCLAAGASDYVAKPFDVEMLLSLLRVWMPKT